MFQINWKLKALLYKFFSIFRLNNLFYFIQKHITKRSKVKITEIEKSWKFHESSIKKNNARNILEIGAGKSLAQNIFFSYKFNNSIKQTLIDINKMIDFELVNQASEQISQLLRVKNKGQIKNLLQLKGIYNIDYKAPFELKDFKKNIDKFDICISTTTLEHFTIADIKNYLIDLKKILLNDAFVSSSIDYTDHYSHTDKSISHLNYLKFSKKDWKKYNNLYLFQNRMRHQDYKKIFESNGYVIKDVTLGPTLKPPANVSEEFDINNKETFIGWACFLIKKENN